MAIARLTYRTGGEKAMMGRLLLEFFARPRATVILTAVAASVVLTGNVFAFGGSGCGP